MNVDIMLKATKVDGIYTNDPQIDQERPFHKLSLMKLLAGIYR